jgi:Flp pilus assembly protein TadG
MNSFLKRSASERGGVLVQTAVALLMLIAFLAFVVDFGVLWVARAQAQNAADAGALAGATGMAYDDTVYPPGDVVKLSAAYAALCASGSSSCTSTPSTANPVWSAQSGASSKVDVLYRCPTGYSGNCVEVNVYRNGASGNFSSGNSSMLPTVFGSLLGISHGVKATASAWVAAANATNCLRPFAIPDTWIDNYYGPGGTADVFDVGPDYYDEALTGYGSKWNTGDQVSLFGNDKISPGNFRLLQLYGTGDTDAGKVIRGCTPSVYSIADTLPKQAGQNAATQDDLSAVFALDPSAIWDGSKITGSCVDTHSCRKYVWDASGNLSLSDPDPTITVSPRVMTLPLYDPAIEAQSLASTGKDDLEIVNFIGFFLTTFDLTGNPKQVNGVIVTEAGANLLTGGAKTVSLDSAFLTTIQLIR